MRSVAGHICWIAAIGYATIPSWWLCIHPLAARWRRMRRSPYRVLVPLWMAMWIAAGAATWPGRGIALYATPLAWLLSAALFALAISVYRRARREFGVVNYSGQSELRPAEFEQRLVTTGLHARLRHPIYLAHLAMLAAFTVGSGWLVNYLLLGFALLTGGLMIRLEERELEARFGDQWRAYQLRTPAIFPHRRAAKSPARLETP